MCTLELQAWCNDDYDRVQEDYRQSIRELDEKQIVCLRLTLCEMRNHYVSCYRVLSGLCVSKTVCEIRNHCVCCFFS